MRVVPEFRSDLSFRIVAEADADFAVLGAAADLNRSRRVMCGSAMQGGRTIDLVISFGAPPAYAGDHSEHDSTVIARARCNADAPYDARTCERYPWAAAARIAHLESVIAEMRK